MKKIQKEIKHIQAFLDRHETTNIRFLTPTLKKLRNHVFYVDGMIEECFDLILLNHFLPKGGKAATREKSILVVQFFRLINKINFQQKCRRVREISLINNYLHQSEIEQVRKLRNEFAHTSFFSPGKYDSETQLFEYQNMERVLKAIDSYWVDRKKESLKF